MSVPAKAKASIVRSEAGRQIELNDEQSSSTSSSI
jgi:hypothetical protein